MIALLPDPNAQGINCLLLSPTGVFLDLRPAVGGSREREWVGMCGADDFSFFYSNYKEANLDPKNREQKVYALGMRGTEEPPEMPHGPGTQGHSVTTFPQPFPYTKSE